MSTTELREIVLGALAAVAPDADLAHLDASDDVREALDLDSMDVLRFPTTFHERLGVDIPESDYAQIVSVQGCVEYLEHKQISVP